MPATSGMSVNPSARQAAAPVTTKASPRWARAALISSLSVTSRGLVA